MEQTALSKTTRGPRRLRDLFEGPERGHISRYLPHTEREACCIFRRPNLVRGIKSRFVRLVVAWPQTTDGNEDSSNVTFTSVFPNENVSSLSVYEAFHQFRADYEQASPGTLRLWYVSKPARFGRCHITCHSCLTKTAPVIKRLFSYFRLFALSAYSEPQFWARTLLAFLLCWSGYASQEFVDIILQSSDSKSNADRNRVFRLPSQGKFLLHFPIHYPATQ